MSKLTEEQIERASKAWDTVTGCSHFPVTRTERAILEAVAPILQFAAPASDEELVEKACVAWFGDRWAKFADKLRASLRVQMQPTLAVFRQHHEAASDEEYPHLPICNGDRRFPAGVPGHSCCCLNVSEGEYQKRLVAQREIDLRDVTDQEWKEHTLPPVTGERWRDAPDNSGFAIASRILSSRRDRAKPQEKVPDAVTQIAKKLFPEIVGGDHLVEVISALNEAYLAGESHAKESNQ